MRNVPHDFVSVDMRGLKAALAAQAHALHVSVGRAVVRSAVARELGVEGAIAPSRPEAEPMTRNTVKLSIRLSTAEAAQLADAARAAGMSRGAYIAGLVGGVLAHSCPNLLRPRSVNQGASSSSFGSALTAPYL
jgi:hypothetical protein